MNKTHILNEFQIRSVLSQLKEYNVICIIPGKIHHNIAGYVLFFETDGIILSCSTNYFSNTKINSNPDFNNYLQLLKNTIRIEFDNFNKFIIEDSKVKKYVLKPHSYKFYSILSSQIDNLIEAGFSRQTLYTFRSLGFDVKCQKQLNSGVLPKELYIDIMDSLSLSQKKIAEFIEDIRPTIKKAHFA